jgi:hypothetical protein
MEWTGIPAQRQLTEGQDKDEPLYLPPLHGLPQHIAYNCAAYSAPVQLILKKLNLTPDEYKKQMMTTVFLYAELDGQSLGTFRSNNGNHAEDNLIAKINEMKSKGELKNPKKLVIYLSTSPCSSVYGTCKEAGRKGCQEKLQELQKKLSLTIEVKADHLYQTLSTGEGMKNSGFPMGLSSFSAAANSEFPVSVSHLPNALDYEKMLANENVAQLHPASCHIKTSCMEPALCLQNQT